MEAAILTGHCVPSRIKRPPRLAGRSKGETAGDEPFAPPGLILQAASEPSPTAGHCQGLKFPLKVVLRWLPAVPEGPSNGWNANSPVSRFDFIACGVADIEH